MIDRNDATGPVIHIELVRFEAPRLALEWLHRLQDGLIERSRVVNVRSVRDIAAWVLVVSVVTLALCMFLGAMSDCGVPIPPTSAVCVLASVLPPITAAPLLAMLSLIVAVAMAIAPDRPRVGIVHAFLSPDTRGLPPDRGAFAVTYAARPSIRTRSPT